MKIRDLFKQQKMVSEMSVSLSKSLLEPIARRDKKAFLSDQCNKIEENNRMGKTRDLFKKIKRYQGNISCKDGHKGQKQYAPNRSRRY